MTALSVAVAWHLRTLVAVALAATVVAVVVVAGGWLRYRIETWEEDRG